MSGEQYLVSSSTENKWSKNGYGESVERDQGKFTNEESDLVRRAVEEYCAMKQISTSRLCSECDHKAELKGAWMEIAKSIPHRTVQSVYRHGLRQLHPFKRGPWTEEEVATLCELVARMGKKWSAIQAKLNRSADSCRDKYREMSSEYTKGRWKEPETECLKRLVREHLQADPNADIKELGKLVQEQNISIPWTAISKKMGKRSRLSCFKKWQKLTGLTSPSDSIPKDVSKEKPPPAVTAGAAAAAAVEAARHVIDFNNATEEDLDVFLLTEIINQGKDPPDWSMFSAISNPQNRWNELFHEWQLEEAIEPSDIEGMTLFDVAHAVLERKQRSGDAKLAAATVEAVDLPSVNLGETRAV